MADDMQLFKRTANDVAARVGHFARAETIRKLEDQGRLRQVIAGGEREVTFAGHAMMAGILGNASVVIAGELGSALSLFADSLKYQVNRRYGLEAAHKRVANFAQDAVVRSYEERVVGRNGHQSYRNDGSGRLPGRLGEALRRPDFMRATTTGIMFANRAMLDQVAPHWFRLNFGAAGARASQTRPVPKRVLLFGHHVATLRLSAGHGSRITLPYGIWIENGKPVPFRGGGDRSVGQFYTLNSFLSRLHDSKDAKPKKSFQNFAEFGGTGKKKASLEGLGKKAPSIHDYFGGPMVSTQGSAGRQFLDAGVSAMKNGLQVEYPRIMEAWFADAANAAGRGGPIRKLGVSPTAAARYLKVVRSSRAR